MKKTLKYLSAILGGVVISACGSDDAGNGGTTVPPAIAGNDVTYLIDNDLTTVYEEEGANISFIVETQGQTQAYAFFAAEAQSNSNDPIAWTVYGSDDKSQWTQIETQSAIDFWARFQERRFALSKAANYKYLKFEVQPKDQKTLRIADLKLYAENPDAGWEDFSYPLVPFENQDAKSKGSEYYNYLVQNKEGYLKYHAREVAKILYYDAANSRNDIQQIKYILKQSDVISAKSGNIPSVQIAYSTTYIEQFYQKSMAQLDAETRGVLFHEMTHCYQYEPKNCGSYDGSSDFWAFMEGVADAVRIQAGYVDYKERTTGGWYSDGYKRTGFFLDWLTTKDPDALRKFNQSAKDLDTWTFDGAMKYIFGQTATVKALWQEYQNYLKSNN